MLSEDGEVFLVDLEMAVCVCVCVCVHGAFDNAGSFLFFFDDKVRSDTRFPSSAPIRVLMMVVENKTLPVTTALFIRSREDGRHQEIMLR